MRWQEEDVRRETSKYTLLNVLLHGVTVAVELAHHVDTRARARRRYFVMQSYVCGQRLDNGNRTLQHHTESMTIDAAKEQAEAKLREAYPTRESLVAELREHARACDEYADGSLQEQIVELQERQQKERQNAQTLRRFCE
jgi:hypothetical protein